MLREALSSKFQFETLIIGDVGGQFHAIVGMDYLADAPHDVHHRGPFGQ